MGTSSARRTIARPLLTGYLFCLSRKLKGKRCLNCRKSKQFAHGLAPFLVGSRILRVDLRRKDLRFPFPENFATRLEGRRIVALNRRAKYLLANLDDDQVLIAHLGMSGSFRLEAEPVGAFKYPRNKNPAHDHVAFSLETGLMVYNDPRRFGFMTLAQTSELADHPYFAGLGVEPLVQRFQRKIPDAAVRREIRPSEIRLARPTQHRRTRQYLCLRSLASRRTFADATGGKPYGQNRRDARPRREAGFAGGDRGGRLVLARPRQADGSLGYFQHNFRVYDREGQACVSRACQGTIARRTQNGRSTFYCPICQS